jgi:hypothetical protein
MTLAAVSTHAAPLTPPKSPPAELGAGPPIELARDGCGPGWHRRHWRDRWAIGIGATAFQTKVRTTAGARAGTIPTQIGAVFTYGAGVTHNRARGTTSPRSSISSIS